MGDEEDTHTNALEDNCSEMQQLMHGHALQILVPGASDCDEHVGSSMVQVVLKLSEWLLHAGVRSAIIFCSTCKGCALLSLVLEELGLACAALHSGVATCCWFL